MHLYINTGMRVTENIPSLVYIVQSNVADPEVRREGGREGRRERLRVSSPCIHDDSTIPPSLPPFLLSSDSGGPDASLRQFWRSITRLKFPSFTPLPASLPPSLPQTLADRMLLFVNSCDQLLDKLSQTEFKSFGAGLVRRGGGREEGREGGRDGRREV